VPPYYPQLRLRGLHALPPALGGSGVALNWSIASKFVVSNRGTFGNHRNNFVATKHLPAVLCLTAFLPRQAVSIPINHVAGLAGQ
jgi:hypothetical protein